MHVHTVTALSPETVRARLERSGMTGSGPSMTAARLIYAHDRRPPKLFLTGALITPPAAAEISITEQSGGAQVILRLMWGPLPAPFPRALAAAGGLLGLLILAFTDRTAGDWLLASLVILLPAAALLCQRMGERQLQAQLSRLLDGATFVPRPH